MKFVDTKVTFAEVPDEISLCLNISGCPIHCPDCHSKYLWEDIGTEITFEILDDLILKNPGISCICFCGGDGMCEELLKCFQYLQKKYPNLKIAWYSGSFNVCEPLLQYLDYVKVGPYVEFRGGLDQKTTNQRFYRVTHTCEGENVLENITEKFWTKEYLEI